MYQEALVATSNTPHMDALVAQVEAEMRERFYPFRPTDVARTAGQKLFQSGLVPLDFYAEMPFYAVSQNIAPFWHEKPVALDKHSADDFKMLVWLELVNRVTMNHFVPGTTPAPPTTPTPAEQSAAWVEEHGVDMLNPH